MVIAKNRIWKKIVKVTASCRPEAKANKGIIEQKYQPGGPQMRTNLLRSFRAVITALVCSSFGCLRAPSSPELMSMFRSLGRPAND